MQQLRKKLAYATACCLAGEYLCSPVVFYELPINQYRPYFSFFINPHLFERRRIQSLSSNYLFSYKSIRTSFSIVYYNAIRLSHSMREHLTNLFLFPWLFETLIFIKCSIYREIRTFLIKFCIFSIAINQLIFF